MAEENEILKRLVVEKKDGTEELEKLVEELAKVFRIEQPSGRILFQNFGELTDKQRILALLVGKYFANRLGMVKDAPMSISEIAKELGRKVTSLSGPIKNLIDQGFVELAEKKYKIAYHRIKEVADKMLITKVKE